MKSITEEDLLTDEEVRALSLAIFKRHGIDFTSYEIKSLKRRVARAMYQLNCSSLHDLWVKILRDQDFIHPFMDAISVGLTAMFRDPILWRRMRDMLTHKYSQSDISVWHAGCSTGEEVFSMSIVAYETNSQNKIQRWLATDISNNSLKTAQEGVYHSMKKHEYDTNYREYRSDRELRYYYHEEGSDFKMKNFLTEGVNFNYHNLITDKFPADFDIIFCRNVMIYFDLTAKQNLFKKFHQALKPGGLLIIGFYDAVLPIMDDRLFQLTDADAKIFQRVN